jgi:aryl-alcohol dehydrogenase-like predicted oxidoreductase
MQLPGPGVFGPPRDRDAALAVLRRAVELGVEHIDTAQASGPDVANELRPNVLLIPGTSSVRHLEENLAASGIELDEQAQDELGAAT